MPIIDRVRGMFDFGGPKASIEVEHASEIDEYDRPRMDAYIKSFVGKYEEIIPIKRLVINIKRHRSEGTRSKYSMNAALYTGQEVFRNKSFGWDVFAVADDMMIGLRKQAIKEKAKSRTISRTKVRRAKN